MKDDGTIKESLKFVESKTNEKFNNIALLNKTTEILNKPKEFKISTNLDYIDYEIKLIELKNKENLKYIEKFKNKIKAIKKEYLSKQKNSEESEKKHFLKKMFNFLDMIQLRLNDIFRSKNNKDQKIEKNLNLSHDILEVLKYFNNKASYTDHIETIVENLKKSYEIDHEKLTYQLEKILDEIEIELRK